jgi:hypothetical protein
MTTSRKVFRDLNNWIGEEITKNQGFNQILNDKTKMFNEGNKQANLEKYNEALTNIENLIPLKTELKERSVNTINNLNQYIDSINLNLEKMNEFVRAINNNRLRFGLKGQLKRELEEQQLPHELLTEEQKHALEQPYQETPSHFSDRGGKKTRRRTKRQKTRRRKIKKNYL